MILSPQDDANATDELSTPAAFLHPAGFAPAQDRQLLDQCRVVFDGRRLYESHTLVSCGIQQDDTVYIHAEQIGD